uniref:hypothetical protein n=1 Tax=Pleionea sediminis TaxID=2569479 RepID=UPI0013DDB733
MGKLQVAKKHITSKGIIALRAGRANARRCFGRYEPNMKALMFFVLFIISSQIMADENYLHFKLDKWKSPSYEVFATERSVRVIYFKGGLSEAKDPNSRRCEGKISLLKLDLFLKELRMKKIGTWKSVYEKNEPGLRVLHGTSWLLEIKNNKFSAKSSGYAAFPENFKEVSEYIKSIEQEICKHDS